MASELKVDKFTGVTTAGSIDVTGEGNSTTTNLQQGLNKVWVNYKGTATNEIRDSFNVTSVTDSATGRFIIIVGNDFSNDDYAVTSNGAQIYQSVLGAIGLNANLTSNTSQIGVGSTDNSGNDYDQLDLHFIVSGDLA